MAKKKVVNERCPLQSDCERKCEHIGSECNCDFFVNNLSFETEDAAIRNGIVLPKESEHIDWDSIPDVDELDIDDSDDFSDDVSSALDDGTDDRDVAISVSDTGVISYLGGERGYTAKIQDAITRTRQEFMYIGMLLLEIDAYGYYAEGGFSDVYEYAEVTFGFKRSSTNNFMRVYRKFGEAMGIQERFREYSYSQLVEMCSMDDKQILSCSPEMSVLRLREVKKGSSVQTSGRQLSLSSNSTSLSIESFEDVVKVPKCNIAKLHCPLCDYYFNNNYEFYRFCHCCGSGYEVIIPLEGGDEE